MSPQICNQLPYTEKTDIWSSGIVFINIMTLEYPNINPPHFIRLNQSDVADVPDHFKALRDFICSKMVVLREIDRASVDEIIADPVFCSYFQKVHDEELCWLHKEKLRVQELEEELHRKETEIQFLMAENQQLKETVKNMES